MWEGGSSREGGSLMPGMNLALSLLQPHGGHNCRETYSALPWVEISVECKHLWGTLNHIESLFANSCACACGSIQLASILRNCLQSQQVKRNGSFRHGSGFWMPVHAPHECSIGTNGIWEDVRGLLECPKRRSDHRDINSD